MYQPSLFFLFVFLNGRWKFQYLVERNGKIYQQLLSKRRIKFKQVLDL